jgi:hypothetical protein
MLGVLKTTRNDFIYAELGRLSFQNIRYFNMIKFWLKIVNLSDNKNVRKVHLMLQEDLDDNPNHKNWCSLVRN